MRTAPNGPATGNSLGRCYAATLGDCDWKLSREHYVTEALLEALGDSATVSGFPWMESGDWQPLVPKAMASKILCERHNSVLSPLDAEAAKLFVALLAADEHVRVGKPFPGPFAYVSGEAFERWLLKTLIGIVVSGCLTKDGVHYDDRSVPPLWVEVLFGRKPWPRLWRLVVHHRDGDPLRVERAFSFKALEGRATGTPVGIRAEFAGLRLALPLVPAAGSMAVSPLRPGRLVFRLDAREMAVEFGWREDRGPDIEADWGKRPTAV